MWAIGAVALGGAVGSAARYAVALGLDAVFASSPKLPWATFAVNALGSFLLGLFAASALRPDLVSPTARLAITTGFCGGFTTYSTFNLESIKLVQDGNLGLAALNVGATLVVCLLAGGLGVLAGRALFPAA